MRSGELTAAELVDVYIRRIDEYDTGADGVNAVVTLNDNARDRAAELDALLDSDGVSGPLHGIPIVVKDQAMTSDIVTTFGSEIFRDFRPDVDATIVTKVREAGGIIIAKTAMNDWAAGSSGVSSIVGQTRNPYDLDRDPGGSSSGTGAAVAANFATVGIGEDTGGSIRAPSSCCNLFGLRVTTGLISRAGLSPLVERHDTPGPMARTVDDLIRLLDVLVGYDPEDSRTARTAMIDFDSYEHVVTDTGLEGARIGVLREVFGSDAPDCTPVNSVLEDGLSRIADAGGELIEDVTIPDLDTYLENASLYEYQSRRDVTSFLQSLDDPPVDSIDEIVEQNAYPETMARFERIMGGYADPTAHAEYWHSVETQKQFRNEIMSVFLEHDLDAIAFPDLKVVPRLIDDLPQQPGGESYLINTFIASLSSCPAISMPGGFTEDGLPVGIELLGTPYTEHELLSMASHYESVSDNRKNPPTVPSLE
jgi:Asp-tRNA(Asn)/Glu-tRNA(Gln) amidotransferase A subunit family amidase